MASASDYVEDYVDGGEDWDPIESAGLFEGDIDNVSMDDMHQIRSGGQRVSQGGGERDRQTDTQQNIERYRQRNRERHIETERQKDRHQKKINKRYTII